MKLSGAYVGFHFFKQSNATSFGREISLHLFVPVTHILLGKPGGKCEPFFGREVGDSFLNGIQCHALKLSCVNASMQVRVRRLSKNRCILLNR